jgi:hypothetical protein
MLCQIHETQDFSRDLVTIQSGYQFSLRGFGRFTGDVPPIGSTFTINYPENHFRSTATFKVEHHHWVYQETMVAGSDMPVEDVLGVGSIHAEMCVLICTLRHEAFRKK